MEISSKGGRVQPAIYLLQNGESGPPGTWLVFTDYIHAVFAHVSSKGA